LHAVFFIAFLGTPPVTIVATFPSDGCASQASRLEFLLHPPLAGGRRHGAGALDLALVSMISGNRAPISIDQVRSWLLTHCNILEDSVVVQWYFPEDFLITFSFYDDMLQVLHEPANGSTLFILIIKRWRCQLQATTDNLQYRVTI
jgi:hypothetical protein